MTENNPETPQDIPADRDVPSIAAPVQNQKAIIIGFLGLATVAIILVVIDGIHKSEPKSLVTPKEVVFKTSGNTAPYIKTEEPMNPASPPPSVDSLAAQRELAMQQEALRMAQEQQKKMSQRLQASPVIFDEPDIPADRGGQAGSHAERSAYAVQSTPPAGNAGTGSLLSGGASDDGNIAFVSQNANRDVETAEARQIQNLSTLLPQGTMIAGILETAIQSDLPGMIRAVVSENIYSFDGSHLVVPQGARLIGQYRSGLVRGQSRVFVIWNRLIRNDGASINVGSYGTDDLGRSGLEGDVDTHFFERFGSSVLLSLIDTGLQIGAENANSRNSATVAVNTGDDFSKAAEIALENSIAIPPTINIDQGTRIKVFVGKDLDFSRVKGNEPTDLVQ